MLILANRVCYLIFTYIFRIIKRITTQLGSETLLEFCVLFKKHTVLQPLSVPEVPHDNAVT